MTDSNPIQDSDISEMEPETSQTDNTNVEVEENDLPKYIDELDNSENNDYLNDFSDYNPSTNIYEALAQLSTSENEIDQPIDQPIGTSINENEPIRFTNGGVVNTDVYMTEPDQLHHSHTIMDESRNFIEGIYEETSQPVVFKKTEIIQHVTSNTLDNNPHKTEPELIEKEIYEKKIETIWPANANIYNNEIEDDDDDDEIEEVKMIKIQDTKQQIRRRPIIQQLQESSLPPNNITSSNVHPHVKKYSLSYIFKVVAVLALISLFFYSQLGKKPSFLRKFADTTNAIFKEINSVELPDVNTINDHTVSLRRAAITFDRSPVFKSHGSHIAAGLRDLGDTIRDAGQLLRNMYSKGSSVHTSFDIEIDAMVQMADRLDSHHLQGDYVEYFKERLNKLAAKIKDFRQSVEKVHGSIIDAEEIKLDNEVKIENGFREAEKFRDNEKYSVEISKARNDIAPVNDIFNHLRTTADRLDEMRIMLKDHEDKLIGISDELGDEGIKFTKSDLKYLQRVVDHSKASRDKFDKFAQIFD